MVQGLSCFVLRKSNVVAPLAGARFPLDESQRAAIMGGRREAGAIVSTGTSVVTGTRRNGHVALYVPTTGGKE
jgi:hypothetical protein